MFKLYSKTMGYVVLTILILSITSGVLYTLGVFKERVVFENSFQYKEGMKQRANTLQAQLAEIDMRIIQHPEMRTQLEAQRKVLEIQLQGIK